MPHLRPRRHPLTLSTDYASATLRARLLWPVGVYRGTESGN